MSKELNGENQKVKFSISFKLVLIFVVLVIAVLGLSTYMVSTMVRKDERIKAEENNHTINGRTAEIIQNNFLTLQNNALGLFNTVLLLPESQRKKSEEPLFNDFFNRNSQTVFLYEDSFGYRYNEEYSSLHKNVEQSAVEFIYSNKAFTDEVKNGQVLILNASEIFRQPVICIMFPHKVNEVTRCAIIGFAADDLINIMSTGSYNTTFLISRDGSLLIHPDYTRMLSGEKVNSLDAVKKMLESKLDNSQILADDEFGNRLFYAWHRIAGGMLVVTTVTENDVFEAINRTTYRIVLFSFAVFFLAIIVILIFSKTLTRPISELVLASHHIEKGEYELDLKATTRDEIGLLTNRFIDMSSGLAERERLKTTFGKFTNKAIAEKASRGELKLGGENKTATIFFSDIRSFTAMSEKMQPEEVVEFLNEYMTDMVMCVNKTNGVVDKFIGDAVMAEWGVPESSGSISSDAWNAVKAALMMRYTLIEFNKKRALLGKPPVKIGCGINTGPVTAGQIGSEDRMEYTVIGDAVNFASRTESLNKPFGTDILITENTWNYVKDKIIYEEMPSVHVKGKEAAVKMFAVVNAIGLAGPSNMDELRTLLGIPTPDLGKVNTDEEEKKYKIES